MSEVIVRMEMPRRCMECPFADGVYCLAADQREIPRMTWIRRRPDWCPILCELPEQHGRLVDVDKQTLFTVNYGNGCGGNYQSTIADAIGKETMRYVQNIVPATKGEEE